MSFPLIPFIEKAWPFVSRYSAKAIRNSQAFHQMCQEVGIKLYIDEFDFAYVQSLTLFLADYQKEWGEILELPEIRKAFHSEYQTGKFHETIRLLDQHVNAMNSGPLRKLDKVPPEILTAFTKLFQELVTANATPSQMEVKRVVIETGDKLMSVQNETHREVKENSDKLDSLTQMVQGLVNSNGVAALDNSGYQDIIDSEYQLQLDYIKKLLDQKSISSGQAQLLDLKDRILEKGSDASKARLLNNIGYTLILQDRWEEAIAYYQQALEYSDKDIPPITNLIGLYFAQRRYLDAKPLVDKLKDSHPGLSAALEIYLTNEDDKAIEPDGLLTSELTTNSEALVALINVYIKRDKRKALHHAKILYDSAPENDNYIDIYCNIALIALVGERVDFETMELQSEDDKKILLEIRILLEALWTKFEQSDYKSYKLPLLERLTLLLTVLRDHQAAIIRAREILAVDPGRYNAKKLLAMNLMFTSQHEQAAKAFDNIPMEDEHIWEYLAAWMITHARAGRLQEVEEKVDYFIERPDSLEEDHLRIYAILAALLTEGQQFEKALNIIEKALAISPDNIGFLADKARILRGLARQEEVKECDGKIVELGEGDLLKHSVKDRYIAANYLSSIGNFKLAANLMATFVNPNNNSELTIQLADYYSRSGRKNLALPIYENLRLRFGVSPQYTRHEAEIYYYYKDYDRAIEVLEPYIQKFPEDFRWWLNLGALYMKAGREQSLQEFCQVDIAGHDFTFDDLQTYLSILHLQGHFKRCLDLVYNYRRKHPGLKANQLYVGYCMQDPTNKKEVDDLKVVDKDTAVSIVVNGNNSHYIIEDLPEDKLIKSNHEINLKDKVYKLLKGKSVGAKISFDQHSGTQRMCEITAIVPKYRFAFQEAIHQNSTIYALDSGYIGGQMNTVEDLEKLIDGQLKQRETVDEFISQAEINYQYCGLPLQVFARFNHKSPIEIFDYFIAKGTGIRYSIGEIKLYSAALQLAQNANVFVLDVTALLTLHRIGMITKLPKPYRLVITRETRELIDNYIAEKEYNSQSDHISVFEHNGEKVRMLIRAEDKLAELTRLKDFAQWVDERVEVLPCKLLLEYDDESAKQFKELFGPDVLESALLSKELGGIYISDDAANRRYIEEKFQIISIWTQPFLKSLTMAKVVDDHEYNDFIYELIKLGHQHTTIDTNDIILALQKSNFEVRHSFETLCKILSGKFSDAQSVTIALSVIAGIFQQNIPARKKETLIYFVLLSFIGYRSLAPTIEQISRLTLYCVRSLEEYVTLENILASLISDIRHQPPGNRLLQT